MRTTRGPRASNDGVQPPPASSTSPLAAALAQRRRALEQQEETLVLLAGTQGIQLTRRPDADPRIVLTTILAEA